MSISFRRAPSRMALPILFPLAVLLLLFLTHGSAAPPQSAVEKPILAATPPMGWNSWDSYSRRVNEDNKANAKWLAKHLKSFGWEYVVVDEGWYLSGLGADGKFSLSISTPPAIIPSSLQTTSSSCCHARNPAATPTSPSSMSVNRAKQSLRLEASRPGGRPLQPARPLAAQEFARQRIA